MSSYTQLLNNYLTNSHGSNNASKPDLKTISSVASNSYKIDNKNLYKEPAQYLPPNYTSFSSHNDSRNILSNENWMIGNQNIKKSSNSNKTIGVSDFFERPGQNKYNTKSNSNTLGVYDRPERKSVNDLLRENSQYSPNIDILKKKHEESTARAIGDLLTFKTYEGPKLSANRNEKSSGYSNILKEIDACVNEMKKCSARPNLVTQPDELSTKPDHKKRDTFDRSADISDRKTYNEDPFDSDPLSTIHFRSHETDFASDLVTKQLEANKAPYQINQFLPQKKLMKTEVISEKSYRKENQTHSSPLSRNSVEKSRQTVEKNDTKQHRLKDSNRNQNFNPQSSNLKEKEAEEKNRKLSENSAHARDSFREKHNKTEEDPFYEFVKAKLRREKLLEGSKELIEALPKIFIGILENYPGRIHQGEQIQNVYRKRKFVQDELTVENFESANFVPMQKPLKELIELRSCDTQTEDESTPFFKKEITGFHKLDENGKDRSAVAKRPVSHTYALSFSDKKEENAHPPTIHAQIFDIRNYLPHFENISNSNQNPPHAKEESPSFFKSDNKLNPDRPLQERLSSQTQNSKDKQEKGLFASHGKDRSNGILIHEDISAQKLANEGHGTPKTNFLRSKEPSHSEKNSAKSPPAFNRSAKESPNFFLEDNEELVELKKSQGRSPKASNGLKKGKELTNTELHIGHRSATNLFSADLKNETEKQFLSKIQTMQQSFTDFLKQKIEEVQEVNHNEINKGKGGFRSGTPIKSTTYTNLNNKQPKDAKPTIPKPVVANKTVLREEKLSEFPRKRSVELKSHKVERKSSWIEVNFQGEADIDKIIRSFL